MELIELLRILRRWLWLIVVIVIVAELALWFGTKSAEPVYAATVSLQVSSPQREDVAAYDEYRSISLRDEIVTVINNFIELLESEDVRQSVIDQLGLDDEDALYKVSAQHMTDADFVNVTVEARTPSLASLIANTHVNVAIAFYGELRSKITIADKDLFAEQLQIAEQKYQDSENALVDFRIKNGLFVLTDQINTQQDLLTQLELERDRRALEQALADTSTTNSSAITANQTVDPVEEIDKLIAKRKKEMDRLTTLAPQYNILTQNVDKARADYEYLLDKYSEAQLKTKAVQAANFIQVTKPAYTPAESESNWPQLAVLTFVGSLGLGVLLVLLLQYFSNFQAPVESVIESDGEAISHEHQKKVTKPQISKDLEGNHKKSPDGFARQEFWKRFVNALRQDNSSHKDEAPVLSKDLDMEPESIAPKNKNGSQEVAKSTETSANDTD